MSTMVDAQTGFALLFVGANNRAIDAEARLVGVETQLRSMQDALQRAEQQRDVYLQRLEGRFR